MEKYRHVKKKYFRHKNIHRKNWNSVKWKI